MSIEETIQFLTDSAAEQEAKLAKLERNSALLEKALRRLSDRQKLLELWAAQVQAVLTTWNKDPIAAAAGFVRRKAIRCHTAIAARPAARAASGISRQACAVQRR